VAAAFGTVKVPRGRRSDHDAPELTADPARARGACPRRVPAARARGEPGPADRTAHGTRRSSPGGLALWYPPAVQPDPLSARRRPVQLFVTAIQYPIQFGIAILVAGGFVTIFLRAAISPERKTGAVGWVRAITGPNAKLFFGILFLGWVAVSGLLIPSFPNTANSPYGAIALISMFTGFFIMMGLLWAVIGE
jgi:hypothetical protein